MPGNQKLIIQELGESVRECTQVVEESLRGPDPGEVLIRHHYAGVNGIYDQMMCLDRVEHTRVTPPADAGVEAVGVVEQLGTGVDPDWLGQAVATVKAGRGYRLWQLCKTEELIPVPESAPWVLAVIPSGVSALVALEQVAELSSGETVCISAAAGGLGNMLSQLAVRAGNKVIAISSGEKKRDWLKSIGVHRVVDRHEEDVRAVLTRVCPDGINLALDSVGGDTFDAMLDNIAPRGRLVACGYTSDRLPTAKVEQERIYTRLYWKAASVRGFMNWRFAEHHAAAREKLFGLIQSGELSALIDPEPFLGLASISDAVEYQLAGQNLGKVTVDLRGKT